MDPLHAERITDGADVGRVGLVGEVGRQVTRAEALRISRQILERAEQERLEQCPVMTGEDIGEDIEPIENIEQLGHLGWQLACEQEEEGDMTEQERKLPTTAELTGSLAGSPATVTEIIDAIWQERHYQDRLWGGPAHDDGNSSNDWIAKVVHQLGKCQMDPFDLAEYRKRMVKVAALAVAAIEWADRIEVP